MSITSYEQAKSVFLACLDPKVGISDKIHAGVYGKEFDDAMNKSYECEWLKHICSKDLLRLKTRVTISGIPVAEVSHIWMNGQRNVCFSNSSNRPYRIDSGALAIQQTIVDLDGLRNESLFVASLNECENGDELTFYSELMKKWLNIEGGKLALSDEPASCGLVELSEK